VSATDSATLLRRFYDTLVAAYGPQEWWPSESAIETVVGAYLTQNTSWRNVERSIGNLKEAGVLTVEGLRDIPMDTLATLIRPSGYMVRKGAALKAFIRLLGERFDGSLDAMASLPLAELRPLLLDLPGVGPETADAILLYALGQPVMVADEYLRRVVTRHSLLDERARYNDVQQLALTTFSTDDPETLLQHYNEFHALIVMVGKTHCGGVPRCGGCPLNRVEFTPPAQPDIAPRTPGSHASNKARSARSNA
jgi:endonuclease-3 related protein